MSRARRVACFVLGCALLVVSGTLYLMGVNGDGSITAWRMSLGVLPTLGGAALLFWTALFPETKL